MAEQLAESVQISVQTKVVWGWRSLLGLLWLRTNGQSDNHPIQLDCIQAGELHDICNLHSKMSPLLT